MSKDKGIFKDFKSKPPKVHGHTTINHEARMELLLNCSEYVFMDWFTAELGKQKEPEIMSCYTRTGFTPDQQQKLLHSLIKKGFLMPTSDDTPKLTDKWHTAFADLDVEFEQMFWRDRQGKVCWHGSKPKAHDLYVVLRKEVSRNTLIHQRDTYFKFLEMEHKLGFDRDKLMCSVFLGKQRRWEERWDVQLAEKTARYNAIVKEHEKRQGVKPMTGDKKNELYGKDPV